MKKIRVLLCDDHTIIREGIRVLLETEGSFEITGEAANGRQAVDMAHELLPDVVVLDIAMPQLNGLEAARRILNEISPPPKVLMLSAHADKAYIDQVAQIGVSGYLIKQSSADILAKAIKAVCSGKTFYSQSIGKRSGSEQNSRNRKAAIHLTSREREVLQLVAEGRSNKETAEDLSISIKTVEKHRQSVMSKLAIHDTSGLTRYAISAGIIESSVQCTII